MIGQIPRIEQGATAMWVTEQDLGDPPADRRHDVDRLGRGFGPRGGLREGDRSEFEDLEIKDESQPKR